MKKVTILFIVLSVKIFFFSMPVYAVSESSIKKALESFSEDLNVIPKGITKLAIYGVTSDREARYSVSFVRSVIESEIKSNQKFTLVNREATMDSLSEIELGQSGLVDFSRVKEAGKISGVDAFVFIYPVVSGNWDKRITIMVKAVDVATGAVVFVEEYQYEEMQLFSLILGLKIAALSTNDMNAEFACQNASHPDWSVDAQLDWSVVLELMAGFTIKPVNSSVVIGMNYIPLSKPSEGIDMPVESEYVNDTQYDSTMAYGLESDGAMVFFGGFNLPFSSLFINNSEIVRVRLLYGYGSIPCGSHSSLNLKTGSGTNNIDIWNFNSATINFNLIRLGFDVAISSSINLMLDFDYSFGGKAESNSVNNCKYTYTLDPGLMVTMGVSYEIF